jgi:hypothetical protein
VVSHVNCVTHARITGTKRTRLGRIATIALLQTLCLCAAIGTTSTTGRLVSGPAARRPTCSTNTFDFNLHNGDVYNDTDDVNAFECINGSWQGFGGGGGGENVAFGGILTGTNIGASMVEGSGAALNASGTGTITATNASFSGSLQALTSTAGIFTCGKGCAFTTSGSGSISATISLWSGLTSGTALGTYLIGNGSLGVTGTGTITATFANTSLWAGMQTGILASQARTAVIYSPDNINRRVDEETGGGGGGGASNLAMLTTYAIDARFCSGMRSEGLLGSPGWFTDLPSPGTITQSVAPDGNHPCSLVFSTGASGTYAGAILGYCNQNTTSTACSSVPTADSFPLLSTVLFDSWFVFKNSATITNIAMCAGFNSWVNTGSICTGPNPAYEMHIRYDTSAGDLHWKAITGDATGGGGTHNTTVDLGVTPVASHWTCAHIFSTTVGVIFFQVGDDATSACSHLGSISTISTTLPTSGSTPNIYVQTYDSNAKSIQINRFSFSMSVNP